MVHDWKIYNAGFKDERSVEWTVKSHGGQRLLWVRLLLIFGPAAVLIFLLFIFLDDPGTAACISAAALVAGIAVALSLNFGTDLTIHELNQSFVITKYVRFLYGASSREQKTRYESADIKSVGVQANLMGTNWRTEIATHRGDSISVYFRGNEQNARQLASNFTEISNVQISELSTPEVESDLVEQGVETWRIVLAGIYGLLAALILGYAWFLVARNLELRSGFVALLIGLVVGVVVSFMAGGSRELAYGLLGAFATAVGIAFGEMLTFGSTSTPYVYEFDPGLVIIYLVGLYEGYLIPRRSIPIIRERSKVITEDSWQRFAFIGAALLAGSVVVGLMVDLIPLPNEIMAKSALVKAEEHMAEGRLPEAMDLAYKAIDYKDDYAEAWLTLATLRLGQGNFAAAKRPAENATELDPDSPEAHFMLGLSNYAVGEFDDALESFSMAISLESQMDLARVFLADTYSVLGNYELAVEEINAAIGPDLDAAYRAWALGPDLDAADRAWALSIRSEAFGELGQYDKAIDDCLAAVEANELEPLAHYACGINYYAIGDEEKAAEYLNASLLNGLDYIQRQEALRLLNEIEG